MPTGSQDLNACRKSCSKEVASKVAAWQKQYKNSKDPVKKANAKWQITEFKKMCNDRCIAKKTGKTPLSHSANDDPRGELTHDEGRTLP